MNCKGTILVLLGLMIAFTAEAQPDRSGMDVIWVRDIAGAQMTLDGMLNEPVWQKAEKIQFVWNGDHAFPGSGQRTEGTPTLLEPSDPINATVYVLRDGNTLWLAAEVKDKSIGGARGLWGMDGLVMNILDRERFLNERANAEGVMTTNFFQGNRTEFFYSWWNNPDTTSATDKYWNGALVGSGRPIPGLDPRFHGFYGHNSVLTERDAWKVDVWDARTVVDGIANDDTHGEDVGYTMEMRIDLGYMGYDFTQAGGDKAAWNINVQDQDFGWPNNPDLAYLSRVWWQNQWGNNFNDGIGYLVGEPGVTVDTPLPAVTEPEFTIPNGELFAAPTIDGVLDDFAWERIDPVFAVQYQPTDEVRETNPLVAQHYMFYFRPAIFGQSTALVVDPSVARFKMFHRGNFLYVGVDVDDQAISGIPAEGGMDGIYLFLRDRDSLHVSGSSVGTMITRRFDFRVDSSGAVVMGADALAFSMEDPTSIQAAISLKGASTAADPSDVDEGYQIEIAIDLTKVLGYPDGLGDRMLWTAMNFLDGDILDSEADSYAMRTWILTERGGGGNGATIYGYLDPNEIIGTSTEAGAELPSRIELLGNYPNPFNPTTTLRYALPHAGNVTISFYDVMGRQVTRVELGPRSAGESQFNFNASSLASGVYFYRVAVEGVAGTNMNSSVGRMMLVK